MAGTALEQGRGLVPAAHATSGVICWPFYIRRHRTSLKDGLGPKEETPYG
jgi:hypothetical protein